MKDIIDCKFCLKYKVYINWIYILLYIFDLRKNNIVMEGLEISGVEKRKLGGASTGFDLFGDDETISELDVCVGDEMDLE